MKNNDKGNIAGTITGGLFAGRVCYVAGAMAMVGAAPTIGAIAGMAVTTAAIGVGT